MLAWLVMPFGIALSLSVVHQALQHRADLHGLAGFFAGSLLWLLLAFGLGIRPGRLYIFAHESTHVLAAWLCGGRVLKFHVGRYGGHVDLTKTNAWIALAPYWFPLIPVLIAVPGVLLMPHTASPERVGAILGWVTGLAYGHHVASTWWVLQEDQKDIRDSGWWFSLVMIWLGNWFWPAVLLPVMVDDWSTSDVFLEVLDRMIHFSKLVAC